ncbi:MAG TPA: response regulator [bacterium]|nr:response regulator [bacterium]
MKGIRNDAMKKILVIEDNPAYHRILRMRLESRGYRVLSAWDGLTGFEMARREKPDLVLSDLMLPRMNGHKVTRMLKFDRIFSKTPVVILTSRDLEMEADSASQCRADAFIPKTTHPDILMDVIEKLIEQTPAGVEL